MTGELEIEQGQTHSRIFILELSDCAPVVKREKKKAPYWLWSHDKPIPDNETSGWQPGELMTDFSLRDCQLRQMIKAVRSFTPLPGVHDRPGVEDKIRKLVKQSKNMKPAFRLQTPSVWSYQEKSLKVDISIAS